jgi:ABC-type multidrug transport system fused ATPase/permease subunit
MKDIISIFEILNKKEKIQTYILFFFSIFIGILEFLSIGSVITFIILFLKNAIDFQNQTYYFLQILEGYNNYVLALFIFLSFLVKNFVYYLFLKYQFTFIAELKKRITNNLYKIYLSQEYEFYFNRNSKELLRNISLAGDFSTICLSWLMFFCEIFTISILIIFLIYIDLKFTLICIFIFSFIGFFYIKYFRAKIFKLGLTKQILDGKLNRNIIETYQSIKEIKIYQSTNFFRRLFDKLISSHAEIDKKFSMIQNLPRLIFEIILITLISGILVYLELLQYQSEKNIIILSSFSIVAIRLVPSITKVISSIQRLTMLGPNIHLLRKEFNLEINIKDQKFENTINENFNCLELDSISYSYQEDHELNVIKNVSLKINKGEIFGIFGKSGSGKSTLLNIVLGLLAPNSGKIRVNNKEILDIDKYFNKRVGYVPQSVYLFDDTIKNNVIFDNTYDKKFLDECIEVSCLDDFVESLPNNIGTEVGEESIKISGGQKQRIGLARALFRKPEILILDEATNSVDFHTQLKIFENLKKFKQHLTIILISHEERIIEQCDKIYDIEKNEYFKKK